MKLPFFQNKEKKDTEYYLALLLTDEKVTSVILQESLGVLKILGKHEEFFLAGLEDTGLDQLIGMVDKTLSRAEEVLPPNVQTHKTVFGVKQDWVEEETKKIKKDNLAKLKKICDELDLTPIGFMVITEAISHLLQEEEGAPLSAILAEIGKKTVTLTLLRGGKIIEKVDGPLHDSAPATVDKLLTHFTATVLPARIILYDAKEADALSQQFINHQWAKSLPFLHVPQITALPAGFDAKAVTFGASQQMGFAVAGLNLKELKEENVTVPTQNPTHHEATHHSKEHGEEKKDEEKISEKDDQIISSDNFGFVTGQDITNIPLPTVPDDPQHSTINLDQPDREPEFESEETPKRKLPDFSAMLAAIHLPKISLPQHITNKQKILIPVIAIVAIILLIVGTSYFYFSTMKATIVLSVTPRMVDQTESITFSGTSSSDFSNNVIAAKALSTTVNGSATIDTTGKKDVGDKAKGKVTVYNNANSSTKLESGTQIKSSNNIIFVLDKDITVASASGDIFSGTKPGTTDVEVTAKEIGTEGNLPSGTKFTIGSNASLAAKNDSAFSGGSKKQVQVVSNNDVAKLKTELPKNLESKAKDQITQQARGGEQVLPFINVVGLENLKFDNDVDKEAKKVKLTADVTFESLAYEEDELTDFAKSLLKEKYSQDISDESLKATIQDPEEKKEKEVEAELVLQAGLLPDIDTADVVKKVENMSLKDAKLYLSQLPQIAKSDIVFSPGIPLLPNLFPRLPKQISIEVKTE